MLLNIVIVRRRDAPPALTNRDIIQKRALMGNQVLAAQVAKDRGVLFKKSPSPYPAVQLARETDQTGSVSQ